MTEEHTLNRNLNPHRSLVEEEDELRAEQKSLDAAYEAQKPDEVVATLTITCRHRSTEGRRLTLAQIKEVWERRMAAYVAARHLRDFPGDEWPSKSDMSCVVDVQPYQPPLRYFVIAPLPTRGNANYVLAATSREGELYKILDERAYIEHVDASNVESITMKALDDYDVASTALEWI